MRMIRLVDAINIIEEQLNSPYSDDESTASFTMTIVERLINAEHVEVDKDNLGMLQRMGLWRENRTVQEIWADQHKGVKYTTTGGTK